MEMQWLAILGSMAAGGIAVITFWVNHGKLAKTAEDSATNVAALTGKLALLETSFSNHRVDVAANYTTNAELKTAIDSFTQSIDRLDRRLESYLDFARTKDRTP